ncbi:hypothetical protein [Streptomyces sp. MMS24-I29]|uniref:hypothetical protein n=1 Tax=Streptomyces sp. MMS24-I29 TaxID=3351480 RepID=UPI003C7C4A72
MSDRELHETALPCRGEGVDAFGIGQGAFVPAATMPEEGRGSASSRFSRKMSGAG